MKVDMKNANGSEEVERGKGVGAFIDRINA